MGCGCNVTCATGSIPELFDELDVEANSAEMDGELIIVGAEECPNCGAVKKLFEEELNDGGVRYIDIESEEGQAIDTLFDRIEAYVCCLPRQENADTRNATSHQRATIWKLPSGQLRAMCRMKKESHDARGAIVIDMPLSPAGRIVCMYALDAKIREINGQLAHYRTTAADPHVDHEWIRQQELMIEMLTNDLACLRDE